MITQTKTIMTPKIICVSVGTSLFEANELMKEKRIRHLPVVDHEDQVIGIISQRDLHYVPDSKNLTVEMLMSSPVTYVDSSTPLRQAIFKMLENKISSLLVNDGNDNIVGIITTDDLLWHLARVLSYEKDEKNLFENAMYRQTIGEIANEAALVGI